MVEFYTKYMFTVTKVKGKRIFLRNLQRFFAFYMKRLCLIIDLVFCLVVLPLLICIFPVERWFHNFPVYTLCAGAWLYAVYALNRTLVIPVMFRGAKGVVAALLLSGAIIAVTGGITGVRLYAPHVYPYDTGFVHHLPMVAQYQQCIWSLFVIIECFSASIGVMLWYDLKKSEWLLSSVNSTPNTDIAPSVPQSGLSIKVGRRNMNIAFDEIVMVEAMENYVKLHRKNQPTIITHSTLKAVAEILPSDQFVRVHRSYIVARGSITSHTSREVYLAELDTYIPLGRKYGLTL